MGYLCPVPQEGRVREPQRPKVPFKWPNFLQGDQGFTDLRARFWTQTPFFSSLLAHPWKRRTRPAVSSGRLDQVASQPWTRGSLGLASTNCRRLGISQNSSNLIA